MYNLPDTDVAVYLLCTLVHSLQHLGALQEPAADDKPKLVVLHCVHYFSHFFIIHFIGAFSISTFSTRLALR